MRNVRGEMWKDLNIADLPRLSRFPFPVQSLGYTHGGIYPEGTYHYERFEVCIRRYSQAVTASECVNGTVYRVKFPNVIMKTPGTIHSFAVDLPRDVVHFTYAAEMEAPLREMLPFPEKPIWEIHLGTKENQLITELMDLMEKSHEFGVTDRIDLAAFQLLELLIFSYNYSILRPDYYETRQGGDRYCEADGALRDVAQHVSPPLAEIFPENSRTVSAGSETSGGVPSPAGGSQAVRQ